MEINSFLSRHLGPKAEETAKMLKIIGVSSLDELIDQTIPSKIRLKQPLSIGEAMSEHAYLNHIKALAQKNKIFKPISEWDITIR
jgi:glycine dehydrogenase